MVVFQKLHWSLVICDVYTSRKGGTGGDGWGQPQGAVHIVAARLGCKRRMVGNVWASLTLSLCRGLTSGWKGWLGFKQVIAN